MNCSTPGLPVHHHLPEFTQTHVHRVSDAIQQSSSVVPFSSCPQSLPASKSFPMSQLFAWGGQSTGVSVKQQGMYSLRGASAKTGKELRIRLESVQFSSVQSLSRVRLFETPWITARQASLSITNSWSSLRLTSIKSVMPSSHLILGRPLLLLPPIPPSIRVFSTESAFCMRWPEYCLRINDSKILYK